MGYHNTFTTAGGSSCPVITATTELDKLDFTVFDDTEVHGMDQGARATSELEPVFHRLNPLVVFSDWVQGTIFAFFGHVWHWV